MQLLSDPKRAAGFAKVVFDILTGVGEVGNLIRDWKNRDDQQNT